MSRLKLKGNGKKIELLFEDASSFEDAAALVKEEAEKHRQFFGLEESEFSYDGIELSYGEEVELNNLLKSIFGKRTHLTGKIKLSDEEIKYSLLPDEEITRVICRTVRSGETIVSRGGITVYGDVNPGAELVAEGNIAVLGALRGKAQTKKGKIVFASAMNPSQIRIGNVISYNKKNKNVGMAAAKAENGEIILECL